ncbi:MAG: hypothetical protein ACRC2Y_04235 [Aeromonas veronii]
MGKLKANLSPEIMKEIKGARKFKDLVKAISKVYEEPKPDPKEIKKKKQEAKRKEKEDQNEANRKGIQELIERNKNAPPVPKDINLNVACPSTGIVRSRCKCRRCEVARI